MQTDVRKTIGDTNRRLRDDLKIKVQAHRAHTRKCRSIQFRGKLAYMLGWVGVHKIRRAGYYNPFECLQTRGRILRVL